MRRERSMNSYEVLCKELRKIHDSYKGNSGQYLNDVKTFEVVVGDLAFNNKIIDVKTYTDIDGKSKNVVHNTYTLNVGGDHLVPICTLIAGNGGASVANLILQDPLEIFHRLPAKYKIPEGAKLLSTLFKEATVKLQSTQDYNKWFANL
jgi:hypothetical protein